MRSFYLFFTSLCLLYSCLIYFADEAGKKVGVFEFGKFFEKKDVCPIDESKIGFNLDKFFINAGGNVVLKYGCKDNGDPDVDVKDARKFLRECISRFDKCPLREYFRNIFLRTFFSDRDENLNDFDMDDSLKNWEKMDDKELKKIVDKVIKKKKGENWIISGLFLKL